MSSKFLLGSDKSHQRHDLQKYFQDAPSDRVSPVFFQPYCFEVDALFEFHPSVLEMDFYHHISLPALAVYLDKVDGLWNYRHAAVIAEILFEKV